MTLDKIVLLSESGSLELRQPQRADNSDFVETLPVAMGLRSSFSAGIIITPCHLVP